MAQVAMAFGANDFGYAAINAETAEVLGLPRIEEFEIELSKNSIIENSALQSREHGQT